MFFANESAKQEFRDVYVGLFKSSEKYIDIVKALGRKFYGMTRQKISEIIKQHKASHSLQVVLVTSFGLKDKRDASCVNEEVTLDEMTITQRKHFSF